MKHSDELKQVYEYWNEVLNIDNSEKTQNAFIDACRDGNMKSMYGESLYLIIERLLNYHEFEIAEKYVAMHEKMGDKNYKIMLYKAIIQQGKKNDVEALKFFKEAFEGNPEDKNVIDSIMTLSLRNNRKVEKKVLDAALKADTSRLHMLAASCYMADGDVLRAKSENLCALLRAEEACNPAYEQFILFQTIVQNNKDVTRTCIEPDTAACYSKTGERQRWICVYKDRILPFSPYVWNNDYHVYIEDAAGLGLLRKRKGDQVEIDGEKYNVTEIVPIDVYLFRICIKQMAQAGTAKAISLQSVNGKIDVAAFNEWVVQNTPDERKAYDWLIQYNDIQEVPMPLYVYKKFTRLTYLQLVDSVLTSPDIFIRELQVPSKMNEKYIISFSALVALFKAGISVEMIKNGGGYIMESTAFQVSMDTAEIIKEYNRDTVASVGVLDGKVFLNQVDDNKKDFWIQEAGLIKKYCDSIAVVRSDSDLSNYLFDGIDSKDLFGICDYDAISYVRNNDEYSIISTEALLSSLSTSNQVMLQVCNIADWLTSQKIGAEDLLKYIKRLMDEGCLMSITKSVIVFISDAIASADESEVQRLYEIWDQLLASADFYPEQQKNVVIQALTETFSSIEEIAENVDRGILQILIKNLLLLRKQKIGIIIDEKGNLSFEIVCMDSE